MATTARKTKKKSTRKGKGASTLGDTEQPVVVVRNRKSVADTLFKKGADDSVLKTAVVYVGGAFVAYYGAKLLIGNISKQHQENLVAKEEEKSVTTVNTAAAIAGQLKKAIADYGNTDEATVFNIFEGRQIQSRQYLIEVAASYKLQTKGRVLMDDLYNNLDSWAEWWKPDWNRLKPTIDKIMATDRTKFKKATTTTKKK